MSYLYSLYDALVSIAVPADKARAVVDTMEHDMGTTLATKPDLENLRLAHKQDLELLRRDMENRFALLDQKIDAVVTQVSQKIESVKTQLELKIDAQEFRMTVKLGSIRLRGRLRLPSGFLQRERSGHRRRPASHRCVQERQKLVNAYPARRRREPGVKGGPA